MPLVVSAALAVAALWLELIDSRGGSPWDAIEAPVFLSYTFIAGLILTREPRNAVGWLMAVMGLAFPLLIFEQRYAVVAYDGVLDLPGIGIYPALAWTWILLVFIPVPLAFLVPTGRPLTRTWGGALRATIVFLVALLVIIAFGNPGLSVTRGDLVTAQNPVFVPALEAAYHLAVDGPIAGVSFAMLIVLAIVALVVRVRRSRGAERQQLKWIVAGLVFTILALFLGSAVDGLYAVAPVPLPAAIGIAILRYRLYEIDRIISRTLGYAIVTVILGATFAGLVLGLQTLARPLVGSSQVAVAVSTLAVAALFGPLRVRVQALVDRRFYRSRYDAMQLSEGLATRLRDDLDLEAVRGELMSTADAAFQPASVAVWVRQGHDIGGTDKGSRVSP